MPKLAIFLPVLAFISTIAAYFGLGGFSWSLLVVFFGVPVVVIFCLFVIDLFRQRSGTWVKSKPSETSDRDNKATPQRDS